MKKQFISTLFWVSVCILQLVLCFVYDRPLFFTCLFCILLGFMLFALMAIILDIVFKDHILIEGKINEIDNKIIRITLKDEKVRTIILKKANNFYVNQAVLYVESRRSGDFIELREMEHPNVLIGGENEQ